MASPTSGLALIDFGGGITPSNTFDYGVEVLSADLANSADNTLATVLSFASDATSTYRFRFVGAYDSAATTTGSRWTVTCSSTPTMLSYTSRWTLTATTEYFSYNTTKSLPSAASATSLAAGNLAVVEGFIITPSADTVAIQFASEVSASAVTALKGATLTWAKVA